MTWDLEVFKCKCLNRVAQLKLSLMKVGVEMFRSETRGRFSGIQFSVKNIEEQFLNNLNLFKY